MTTNLYEWGYYPQAPTAAFDWESMFQDMEPIPTVTPAYPDFGELEHWGFAAQAPTAAFDWESMLQDMEPVLDVMGRPNQPGYDIDPEESESESESETADWNMVRFVLTRGGYY